MARQQKDPNLRFDFSTCDFDPKQLKLAPPSQISQTLAEVPGQPTTNVKQVLKRFFFNPYATIALIVLTAIVLMALIVPFTSQYSEMGAISNGKSGLISFLPPNWLNGGQNIKTITGSDDSFLQDLINEGIIDANDLQRYIHVGPSGEMYVSYNPWSYLNNLDGTNHNLILGSDAVGRDIWTRLWIGTRQSLLLGLMVALVEATIGIVVGAYIGFHAGSRVDNFLMRIIEVISSVPAIIWFIVLMFIFPPSFWTMFLALVVVGWTAPVARTRVFIIKVKDSEYIKAAESIGVSQGGLIFYHALPNILGKLLVGVVLRIPAVIFTEAALAFLGLAPSIQRATLGNLINDAKGYIEHWWYLLAPTMVILTITISMQLVANGLHDAFDPRTTR
ncbi:ABC transporter permease [Mycoplasma sp. ATU-Cv-508]|uniref:ABC transporter permease subunit n=1 Tax=Mycoplasma sp. ATU-Cv-508 TaxID=2048001 RepID=UPI000FDF5BD9